MMFLEDSDDHANKVRRAPPPSPLKPNAMFKKTPKKSLFPKHAVGADAIVQLCQTSAVHRHCLMQQSSETYGRK